MLVWIWIQYNLYIIIYISYELILTWLKGFCSGGVCFFFIDPDPLTLISGCSFDHSLWSRSADIWRQSICSTSSLQFVWHFMLNTLFKWLFERDWIRPQWSWWLHDGDNFKILATESLWWRPFPRIVHQHIKVVTTKTVINIRPQHRCSWATLALGFKNAMIHSPAFSTGLAMISNTPNKFIASTRSALNLSHFRPRLEFMITSWVNQCSQCIDYNFINVFLTFFDSWLLNKVPAKDQ